MQPVRLEYVQLKRALDAIQLKYDNIIYEQEDDIDQTELTIENQVLYAMRSLADAVLRSAVPLSSVPHSSFTCSAALLCGTAHSGPLLCGPSLCGPLLCGPSHCGPSLYSLYIFSNFRF
jgi:hypothetical protein